MSEPQVSLRDFFDARFGAVLDSLDEVKETQNDILKRQSAAEKAIAVLGVIYTIGAAVIGWIVYKLP